MERSRAATTTNPAPAGDSRRAATNRGPAAGAAPVVSLPTAPNPEFASFRIKPGFRMQIAAREPAVTAPVAMAFDERGRLFVAEMPDYPNPRTEEPHQGRVRLLQDADGDGVYESSAMYAQDLAAPSAIICYGGGVIVAAAPDILFLKDSTGAGVADVRRVLFTGFASPTNVGAVNNLPNSFVWGPDNRVYGSSGGLNAVINVPGQPRATPLALNAMDFSFDPASLNMDIRSGGSQTGLCFDDWGNRYVSTLAHPFRAIEYEEKYCFRNPFFPPLTPYYDVLPPGVPLLRSPAEAAIANAPRPIVDSTSQIWLANARSALLYRSSAFPSNYYDTVFIADPGAHTIHHSVLRRNGSRFTALRAADEATLEFLTSSDPSFHPMQIVHAPDGTLLIADIREAGESGRLYRIIPTNFRLQKVPSLAEMPPAELAGNLLSLNVWRRETTRRLLVERRDPLSIAILTNAFLKARIPQARLEALSALDGLGALTPPLVLKAIADREPGVRETGVRLAERFLSDARAASTLYPPLAALVNDADRGVRLQAAFTLGFYRKPEPTIPLATLLRNDRDNLVMETAVLSSASEIGPELFVALATDANLRNSARGRAIIHDVAFMIGSRARPDDLRRLIIWLSGSTLAPADRFDLLAVLGQGLRRARTTLGVVDQTGVLADSFNLALNYALDGSQPDTLRVNSIRLLGVSTFGFADLADLMSLLFGTGQSLPVQNAAIDMLCQYDDPGVATNFFGRWQLLPASSRAEVAKGLLGRAERVPLVLGALNNGVLRPQDLSWEAANLLRSLKNPAQLETATRLLGPMRTRKPDALDRFQTSLRLPGDANRGRDIFSAQCASCHAVDANTGQPRLGSDLGVLKALGRKRILEGILEPTVYMRADLATKLIETKAGELLLGITRNENLVTITIRQANGRDVILPRGNIRSIQVLPWALMPDDFERGMSPQDMANLLEYLTTAAPLPAVMAR